MSEIFLYDEIGPDWMGMVSTKFVQNELSKHVGKPVTVRINSPGGDVFEGQAIYNMLRRHGAKITVEIDALAASAASYIAMAGDEIRIAENAMIMIHNAWTFTVGDKQEHEKRIALLDKIDSSLVEIYSARIGDKSTPEQIKAWMDGETWMTAKESVERGFADSIGQPLLVAACLKEGRYKNAPSSLIGTQKTEREKFRDARVEKAKFELRLTNCLK